MAVPKRRLSRSNTRHRRSQWKASVPDLGHLHQPCLPREAPAAHGLPVLRPVRPPRQPPSGARVLIPARRGDRQFASPPADLFASSGWVVDPELFDRALTHRSYAYERGGLPTNERLEFLGDSVLGLVVTEHLFVTYPDLSEGQLAKLRAAVVNSRALADVARGLDLGDLIHLGRGEESTGGRDKSSILADTMEAVIGAVFLAARRRRRPRLRAPSVRRPDGRRRHPRGRPGLEDQPAGDRVAWAASACPSTRSIESGPDHAKTFDAMVGIDDHSYGPGAGRNKKEAEQNAAAIAFAAISPQTLTVPVSDIVGA